MSVQGSPTSAAGDGTASMTGEQIALRMVQATEAATAAAQAAAAALGNLSTSSSSQTGSTGTDGKPEWYKVLPKPGVFEPKDREAE